jgi:hypothetical protein
VSAPPDASKVRVTGPGVEHGNKVVKLSCLIKNIAILILVLQKMSQCSFRFKKKFTIY